MDIVIDWGLCESHGQCEYVAGKVFRLDDEGDLHVAEDVGEELRPQVELAVNVCPAQAIAIRG
ncbi:hypothetical protein GCM10009836_36520 [Pseudonocardia ailaonensis]|uniref:Ferredoxin n=1 Tax=Pseudonocardia ailaonensis TaxID=367279 RepID=A0ABN2N539_9PSEU